MVHKYQKMDSNGIKVMRSVASIIFITLLILSVILVMLNYYIFHLIQFKWSLLIVTLILLVYGITFVMLAPVIRYNIFRYNINNEVIFIRKGFFFINTLAIPLFRIQNVDIREGFIMRRYQLASINLSTAGGEAEIQFIDKNEADYLKALIQKQTLDTYSSRLNSSDVTEI